MTLRLALRSFEVMAPVPPFCPPFLHYQRDAGVVTYDARASCRSHLNPQTSERFPPLNALAALTASIPEKGQQVVRYYEYYSNKARGQRRRQSATAKALKENTKATSRQKRCMKIWFLLHRFGVNCRCDGSGFSTPCRRQYDPQIRLPEA